MPTELPSTSLLSSPVQLPCGKTIPNRLCKAAMVELQAPLGGGALASKSLELYRQWAQGGYGMILTGNIAIDETHLGTPFDVTLKRSIGSEEVQKFKEYAAVCKEGTAPSSSDGSHRPLVVVQLVHAGRQSGRGFGRSPLRPSLAPSAVPMATAAGSLPWPLSSIFDSVLWGPCKAMTTSEVEGLIQRFIDAASFVKEVGFDGVQLHASHGYQLAAFLSPRTNTRTDRFGGDASKRFQIIREIVGGIREQVGKDFVVGIKLNSADYVHGGLTEDDALLNVQWLAEMGTVDFCEISGGNYENPSFMMHSFNADEEMSQLADASSSKARPAAPTAPVKKESTRKREAFFASFASRAASVLPPPSHDRPTPMALMLTGGLRSRQGCVDALESTKVSLVGIARASALAPRLPLAFLDSTIPDDDERTKVPVPREAEHPPWILNALPLKLVGAGWTTLYHASQMGRLIQGKSITGKEGALEVLKGLA